MKFVAINILDMIEAIGEDHVEQVLSDFSCPKNIGIEKFIKKDAIDFAKRKISVTLLVMNEEEELAAIFTPFPPSCNWYRKYCKVIFGVGQF